ncbi:hypothetical protein GCM10011588_54580 [Nocardia jinanensis]|uniref:HTH tetR-type domain-containing protein n=2 Tax=Nocardia jinanensis TaxID=382504 RepID=A0A917VW86_9NOCA|nr:hypothetical protein GCM10011588_54580 [Nocardia jinanensis]
MPPVSDRYREARRREVLQAARRCFAREGFAGTSMSDVFAESGMSAGAVYGYFTGKDELVSAIIDQVVEEISNILVQVTRERPPEPLPLVLGKFLQALQSSLTADLPGLAVQVWAEAQRNETLRARLADDHRRIRHDFDRLLEHYATQGAISPAAPIREIAAILAAVGPAFLAQSAILDDIDAAGLAAGIEGLLAARLGDG